MSIILDRFPTILPRDDGSTFAEYVRAHEDELDDYEGDLDDINLSKHVREADGSELNQIGRLFGQVGRRLGRNDEQYRQYLQAVVQAFSGRGTEPSMVLGLSTALAVDESDISIDEDTTNVEYDVVLTDWGPHNVETVYDIAQILDPSGVNHSSVVYGGQPDSELIATDEIGIQSQQPTIETSVSSDSTIVGIGLLPQDDLVSSDQIEADIGVTVGRTTKWDSSAWDSSVWDETLDNEPTTARDDVEVTVNTP